MKEETLNEKRLRERIERLENRHFSLAIVVAQIGGLVLGYIAYLLCKEWLGNWAILIGAAVWIAFGIALVWEHDPIRYLIERVNARVEELKRER